MCFIAVDTYISRSNLSCSCRHHQWWWIRSSEQSFEIQLFTLQNKADSVCFSQNTDGRVYSRYLPQISASELYIRLPLHIYHPYNIVPPYLCDYPCSVIMHCLERRSDSKKFNIEDILTQHQQNRILTIIVLWKVRIYTVNFEGSSGESSCLCFNWNNWNIPCKHFFAIFRFGTVYLLVIEAVHICLLRVPCKIHHYILIYIYCQVAVQ